jgi:DNA-binding NarL/FixJ family response regulator
MSWPVENSSGASGAVAIRILVVDDHPFFREGIMTWISRQNALTSCGFAESPGAALAAIETLLPDLVLLDLQLRNGDGFDVLRGLKNCMHQPRVIVVSHKDETVFAERAIRAGARGYVLKEEASDTMLTAIQFVLSGGIHVSPAMRRQLFDGEAGPSATPTNKLREVYNRELQVLHLLGRGRSTKEIAIELGISPKTVESYRESLKKKLGVPDSLSLIRLATLWESEGRLGDKL